MVRLVLDKDDQKRFLIEVCKSLGMSTTMMGEMLGMSGRNFRDWINGKLLPTKAAIEKLSEISEIAIPLIIEEREEWWSGRVNGSIGGKQRFNKYGNTLTIEDKIKGGHNSQIRRAENPDYYRALGCNIPNTFKVPPYSCQLAEFVGIALGDGGITNEQCEITLHIVDDVEYAKLVKKLIDELFNANASICSYSRHRVIKVVVSGVKFVEILEGFGLRRGNKVKHQVDIPDWIKENPGYLRACMRGLYDTDGGTFTHRHKVKGKEYYNFGLTFTSASKPLLNSFKLGLMQNGFKVHGTSLNVFIYGVREASRFFEVFKPNNPKSRERLDVYLAKRVRVK